MKTATSLVVPIVVASILKERFIVHIAHGWIIEAFHNVGDVGRWRTHAGRVWQRRSSSRLQLALKVFSYIDHRCVVSNMPNGLAK